MNDVIQNIYTRRSVRAFEEKKIPKEELEIIADVARYAPSGMNRQEWRFTVVQDKVLVKKLAKVITQELDRGPDYNFYGADTLIITSAPRDAKYALEDCACALQNMFLAAHSLGIGSVWINQLKGICDVPAVRAVLDEINIPAENICNGIAALGYEKTEPKGKVKKKENVIEFFI
ncbi:MAG: nitroreductase family protein [Ruminococcaceae bacterium]|nr:nitroreductase family protein [Oscillospiraceae bacterium]